MLDNSYLQYASPAQAKYLEAVIKHGSGREAAKYLGIHHSVVNRALSKIKAAAASSGYAPEADMTHPVPAPFFVKGTSTLYGEDGHVKQQWVKTAQKQEDLAESVREVFEGLAEPIKGMGKPIPAPKFSDDDILAVYPMGDPHFGMYAWAAEAGEDFDLDIAERITCSAIDRLVSSGGTATTGLLINLGDFFHADDSNNETPGHGNKLDVDTRYGKVLQVGMRTMIYCVQRLLSVHKNVVVWNMPGNHDPHAAWALAIGLQAYFHNEPRVQSDLPVCAYSYMRFGSNLIGAHHGDGAKGQDLPLVMAYDRKEDWGLTEHRVWHCGHIHHLTRKEFPGCTVETHRTLATKDAWHAMKGYRSGRDQNCILYHREYGEIQRTRCDLGMVQAVHLDS